MVIHFFLFFFSVSLGKILLALPLLPGLLLLGRLVDKKHVSGDLQAQMDVDPKSRCDGFGPVLCGQPTLVERRDDRSDSQHGGRVVSEAVLVHTHISKKKSSLRSLSLHGRGLERKSEEKIVEVGVRCDHTHIPVEQLQHDFLNSGNVVGSEGVDSCSLEGRDGWWLALVHLGSNPQ